MVCFLCVVSGNSFIILFDCMQNSYPNLSIRTRISINIALSTAPYYNIINDQIRWSKFVSFI